MELRGAALATGWFGLFLAGHLALFHFRLVRDRAGALVRVFTVAVVGFGATAPWVLGERGAGAGGVLAATVVGFAVMASLFVLYAPFYYTVAASLSVQTLIEIERAPERALPLSALQSQVVLERLLDRRLEGLVDAGHVVRSGEGFRLTPRGARVARAFRLVKDLWRLGPGG